ncbi:MAG: hypothetical protein ACM3ML_08115 [Micromonosporaceae bacterium]
MSRYVFTEQDLEPLRPILQGPLIAQALAAAVPIKRFETPPGRVEEVELPVPVRSRDQPDGVPLERILEAAKAASPSVRGLAVRGGSVAVIHDGVPTAQQERRLRRLLGDQQTLSKLREPPQSAVTASMGDLERVLLDQATPDAEWMQAFRRYAVEQLIQPQGRG